jgi:hypothetical protein
MAPYNQINSKRSLNFNLIPLQPQAHLTFYRHEMTGNYLNTEWPKKEWTFSNPAITRVITSYRYLSSLLKRFYINKPCK